MGTQVTITTSDGKTIELPDSEEMEQQLMEFMELSGYAIPDDTEPPDLPDDYDDSEED